MTIQVAYETSELHEPYKQMGLSDLLDAVVAGIRRFVVLPSAGNETLPHGYVVLALWAAHTYVFLAFQTTPYLHIWSPTMQSGKTLLLEVLELLVRAPWLTADMTLAALTRKIANDRPTLLYDEGDAGDKEVAEAMRGILNSGYRASGKRTVAVASGSSFKTEDLPTYCPKAFAGIGSGSLKETIRDRAITIELKRKRKGDQVDRGRLRRLTAVLPPLAEQLEAWATTDDVFPRLGVAEPDLPDALSDRQQDCWEPLLAIADLAGGHWPAAARLAAIVLGLGHPDDVPEAETLLADIHGAFGDRAKVFTTDLLLKLNDMDERPWATIQRGMPLNGQGLARRLKDFGIKPRSIRVGGVTSKGYHQDDFLDAWERYLPQSSDSTRHTVTSAPLTGGEQTSAVTGDDPVEALEAGSDLVVTGVTAQTVQAMGKGRVVLVQDFPDEEGANE